MMKQALALSTQPHVVIATPGRLADHLNSTDTLSLKKIKFIVSSSWSSFRHHSIVVSMERYIHAQMLMPRVFG